jgi:uncharacterized membrane protein YfcA
VSALAQVLAVFGAGAVAGSLGAVLGIGGGVFLVPFLNLGLNLPITAAAAISLTTVIATSSSVTAGRTSSHLINMRLGMALEVATAAGSLLGGITAQFLAQSTLQRLFGVIAALSAVAMIWRVDRRNVILDPYANPGRFGGQYHEDESGGTITYRVQHMPIALLASFLAGNVSTLLGVGGGVIKVPVLNSWCGVPLRAAAATSAFMIGVTATAGAIIYFGHGQIIPSLAAGAVLGVQLGSWAGLRLGSRTKSKRLQLLMAGVLVVVAVLMFMRAGR